MQATKAATPVLHRRSVVQRSNAVRRRRRSKQAEEINRLKRCYPRSCCPVPVFPILCPVKTNHGPYSCSWDWNPDYPASFPSIEWTEESVEDDSEALKQAHSSSSLEESDFGDADTKAVIQDDALWVTEASHRLQAITLESLHMHRSMAFISGLNYLPQQCE